MLKLCANLLAIPCNRTFLLFLKCAFLFWLILSRLVRYYCKPKLFKWVKPPLGLPQKCLLCRIFFKIGYDFLVYLFSPPQSWGSLFIFSLSVTLFVHLLATLLKNLWTDFDEIFRIGCKWYRERAYQILGGQGKCQHNTS